MDFNKEKGKQKEKNLLLMSHVGFEPLTVRMYNKHLSNRIH